MCFYVGTEIFMRHYNNCWDSSRNNTSFYNKRYWNVCERAMILQLPVHSSTRKVGTYPTCLTVCFPYDWVKTWLLTQRKMKNVWTYFQFPTYTEYPVQSAWILYSSNSSYVRITSIMRVYLGETYATWHFGNV